MGKSKENCGRPRVLEVINRERKMGKINSKSLKRKRPVPRIFSCEVKCFKFSRGCAASGKILGYDGVQECCRQLVREEGNWERDQNTGTNLYGP